MKKTEKKLKVGHIWCNLYPIACFLCLMTFIFWSYAKWKVDIHIVNINASECASVYCCLSFGFILAFLETINYVCFSLSLCNWENTQGFSRNVMFKVKEIPGEIFTKAIIRKREAYDPRELIIKLELLIFMTSYPKRFCQLGLYIFPMLFVALKKISNG